jgi:hypothetical protein
MLVTGGLTVVVVALAQEASVPNRKMVKRIINAYFCFSLKYFMVEFSFERFVVIFVTVHDFN